MKVVVAIDSLKGSLTSMEAGKAVEQGILRARPQAQVVVKPLADGGEGTTDALIEGLGGERIEVTVTGPYGKPVKAYYGWLKDDNTAVMEMAAAAGITLSAERDPLRATSYGVGEMINDAMHRGIRNFIIGIGGSATNDGGIGMLKALGWKFLDAKGDDTGEGARALGRVAAIALPDTQIRTLLKACSFKIACDVTNPLCGPMGATYIYGPQKGVTEEMKEALDQDMSHYADMSAQAIGADYRDVPGTGAAGGLGFAFLGFLNATLTPGIELILNAVRLEEELAGADIAVTGEGRLDGQTAMGKAPVGVARLAKRHGLKVVAFAGSVTRDAAACNEAGIDAFFPIIRGVTTLEEAMDPENARRNMIEAVEQVFRII